MAHTKLKRLSLPSNVKERFNKCNLHSAQDVVVLNKLELMKILDMGGKGVDSVLKEIFKACAPAPKTALGILQERGSGRYLSTSFAFLDRVLHGGLHPATLTEVTGPPGVGKTQFCTLMSLMCALPVSMGGLEGCVLYIDTELAFSAERLLEMGEAKYPEVFLLGDPASELTSKVLIYQTSCATGFKQVMQQLEMDVIRHRAKLIVLDSMASLVRREFSPDSKDRSSFVVETAAKLKYLAETFTIPVLVTNQITTKFSKEETEEFQEIQLTAALGNSWSHCVNSRFVLQFEDTPTRRKLLIAKSPVSPCISFPYSIQPQGPVFEDVLEEYVKSDLTLQNIRTRVALPFN